MSDLIDLDTLREYLAETLPAEAMVRVEKALRDSAELRARLEDARQGRSESGLHTLGAIWRRGRLTCSTRQRLGSYLLDALDPELASYIRFHLDVVGCPFCQANLDDLKSKAAQAAPTARTRQTRYFQTSRHLLSNEG